MARKPNYSFERMERERADARKAAEKAAKKAEKKAQAAWEAGEGPKPEETPAGARRPALPAASTAGPAGTAGRGPGSRPPAPDRLAVPPPPEPDPR